MTLTELTSNYSGQIKIFDNDKDVLVGSCLGKSVLLPYIGSLVVKEWEPGKSGNDCYINVYLEFPTSTTDTDSDTASGTTDTTTETTGE